LEGWEWGIVRFGDGALLGCGERLLFPVDMRSALQDKGVVTLNHLGFQSITNLWS